jgi:hypothetical protein
MVTLTIKLPQELRAKLEKEATLSGRSVSAVVRESLCKHLSRKGVRRKPSLLALAGELCGIGDSRVADLATNPKHLEGFGEWRR